MERFTMPGRPELALEFDAKNCKELGPCPHCGQRTSRVWGYVYQFDAAIAAYCVEWTPLHAERDATFDLILGRWGEDAEAADRQAVSVDFRVLETGPAFMVQNAATRPIGSSSLISAALDRNDVIGTPLADVVFAVCDLVYLTDLRIAELRN
jgi:hypothetical protein